MTNETARLPIKAYIGTPKSEIDKLFENFDPKDRENFTKQAYEGQMWDFVTSMSTPLDVLKKRKGAWNKDKQDFDWLEYFPEDYTITELNRLFPGWWTDNMEYKYFSDLRTIVVSGDLFVQYPILGGEMKIIKRWAIAGSRIQFTSEPNEKTGLFDAVQPDDMFKAARTEWIKIAGKWYGIGLDIYHQKITPELRSAFEDIVRDWKYPHAEELKQIASTFETGMGFREFLKGLPTPEQTKRLLKALQYIPDDLKNKDDVLIKEKIWKDFSKLRNLSDAQRQQMADFLSKVEKAAESFNKTKEN